MSKSETVAVTSNDVASLTAAELRALLAERETKEQTEAARLRENDEANAARLRSVEGYRKDVKDAEDAVKDAEQWLAQTRTHLEETQRTLAQLEQEQKPETPAPPATEKPSAKASPA